MKEKIYEQVTNYIESMAKGLGVAAEHVYGILVRQQVAEGITTTATFITVLAVLVFLLTRSIRGLKNSKRHSEDFYLATTVVTSILTILVFVMTILEVPVAVMRIINPEYYAIMEIAEVIKEAL